MSNALVIQTACDATYLLVLTSISDVSISIFRATNCVDSRVRDNVVEDHGFLLNQEKLSTQFMTSINPTLRQQALDYGL